MQIDEETVRVCLAARDLARLYDAYRADHRAQIAALQQIRRHGGPSGVDGARLWVREAEAWRSDATYAERGEQVRRRIRELEGLPVRR